MRHFRQAIALADQNINNGVACADDYLQKANCLLFLKNDRQTNIEANQLIEEAKKLDAQNVNIYRLTVPNRSQRRQLRPCNHLIASIS